MSNRSNFTTWFAVVFLVALSEPSTHTLNAQSQAIPMLKERLRLTATGPNDEVVFSYVTAAVRLSSGVIVVADQREGRVSFFAPTGRHIKTVGRGGGGPGEFRWINWIGECARDSVFVMDRTQRRVTVYDSRGTLAREFPISFEPVSTSCSKEGSIVSLLMPDMRAAPINGGEEINYRGPLRFSNVRGDSVGAIASIPLGEPRPLGKFTRSAVVGNYLALAIGDSAYIELWTLKGQRLGGFRAGVEKRPVTSSILDAAVDALVGEINSRPQRVTAKRLMLRQKPVKFLPPYSDIIGDQSGRFWIVETFAGETETILRSFGPTGAPLQRLRLPPLVRVMQVGADFVLAVGEDDNGEHFVVLYDLK